MQLGNQNAIQQVAVLVRYLTIKESLHPQRFQEENHGENLGAASRGFGE
jgi:hypothetical protein